MIESRSAAGDIVHAGQVLSRLGLVDAFGHVSARLDRGTALITPARDLATATIADTVEVDLDSDELPPGAPAEAFLHRAIYRARPEVGAVCRAQPPAALAAAAITGEIRPVHGQCAWLGASVPIHPDPRLLRSAELGNAAAGSLGDRDAMLLRGNGAVTTADLPGLAVARMWVLATTCEIWLQINAGSAPAPVWLSPSEIASWRLVQTELLPRLWQHLARRAAFTPGADHLESASQKP